MFNEPAFCELKLKMNKEKIGLRKYFQKKMTFTTPGQR